MTRVLVLGGGAREHAIVQALLRSPQAPDVVCAPGNVGIAADARVLPLDATDAGAVVGAAREMKADLVVVGPEAPLVAGVTDALIRIAAVHPGHHSQHGVLEHLGLA